MELLAGPRPGSPGGRHAISSAGFRHHPRYGCECRDHACGGLLREESLATLQCSEWGPRVREKPGSLGKSVFLFDPKLVPPCNETLSAHTVLSTVYTITSSSDA